MAQTARACALCGESIQRSRPTGPIPAHCVSCRESARPACPTCGARSGGTPRFVRTLQPAVRYCSDACRPRCSVEGCTRLRRKRAWCSNHYATWHARGDVNATPRYRWATEHRCLVCGGTPADTDWSAPHRRWCSARCQRLWYRHGGQVPAGFRCTGCSAWVPLARAVKRIRSDARLCSECQRWHPRNSPMTTRELADRDGAICRLCSDPVECDLAYPHWLSPSIDHVLPRSAGGTDKPENLQLAHWICNVRRRDRAIEEVMSNAQW